MMPMPKTTVHKKSHAVFREYYVRRSRKISAVKPKAKTESMGCLPRANLRASILSAHPRHQPRPSLGRQAINQRSLRCDPKTRCSTNAPSNKRKYGTRDNGRYAVSDHAEAVPNGRVKLEIVGKSLESRSFPNCYYARFVRMNRPDGLERSAIIAGPGAQGGTLTIPM